MKPVALIGLGPNDIEVPLIIFRDRGECLRFLATHDVREQVAGTGMYELVGSQPIYIHLDGPGGWDNTPPPPLAAALFSTGDYYGGCGELGALIIKEVTFGAPLTKEWDFD